MRPRALAALLALLPCCASRTPTPVTEAHTVARPPQAPAPTLEDGSPSAVLPEGVTPTRYALALSLARFGRFLPARHVREVRHLSIHRPAAPDELQRHPYLARHPGGLAIDAAVFALDDGTEYEVSRDFHGRLGAPVCGPDARVAPANDEHHNHFHLEVTRSVAWRFVR